MCHYSRYLYRAVQSDMLLIRIHLLLLVLFVVSLTNGQKCTGICGGDGAVEQQQQQQVLLVLLNAGQEVIIDGQQGTCGFFDVLCLDDDDDISQKAQDAGCICGIPYNCSGICTNGEELWNATLEVSVNGMIATCEFHDEKVKQEQITETGCLAEALTVQQAGCQCVGSIGNSNSNNNYNYTCSGVCDNEQELLNFDLEVNVDGVQMLCGFHDIKIKEEQSSETGCWEYRQKMLNAGCICGSRYDCPGVCAPGETFLDETFNVTVNGIFASCAFHDFKVKEEIIQEVCLDNAAQVRQAGCICVGNYNCSGICDSDDELLNFDQEVNVDGQVVFCGFHDNQIKEENSESGCLDYRQKVLDAGCVCGIRYKCPGVCGQGEILLNATVNVNVSGLVETCSFYDTKLREEIIEERCLFQASEVREAGCICVVESDVENKFNCTGICHDVDGELLDADKEVNVNDELATCGDHDTNAKLSTSESACLDLAQKAQEAGCSCGSPYDCPGVCEAGEILLNADFNVSIDADQIVSCGFLDAKAKEEIVEEQRCIDAASKAQSAGCICAVALAGSNGSSPAFAVSAFFYSCTLLFSLTSMLSVVVF